MVVAARSALLSLFSAQAGLDMTRDPRYYQGVENCHDMETSKWWANHAESILATVRKNKDESRILWWIAPRCCIESSLPTSLRWVTSWRLLCPRRRASSGE